METVNIIHGNQLLQAGNIKSAEEIAQKALAKNPLDNEAWELSFDCMMARQEYKAARDKVEQWLALDPGVIAAHECFIQACLYLKDKQACAKAIDTMKSSFPTAIFRIKIYEALYDVHFSNGKKARGIFEELSKEHPDIHAFVKLQADTAYKRDQLFKAFRLYREAIKMDPMHASTWRMYSFDAFHIMRYGEARKAARKALELDPKMTELKLLIRISWLVYFPLFYVSSFLCSTYFYLSEFFGKGVGMVLSFFGGYFLFGPALSYAIRWLSKETGVYISPWYFIGSLFLWIAIEQGTFYLIDNKKMKTKEIKLSDY
tara:strand:- start:887 stop:1834 length:948 start_codon:yes stop_codon:yes gene_type:complete